VSDPQPASWPNEHQAYALSVVKPTDKTHVSPEAYLEAASVLEVELNIIKAFAAVEGGMSGAFLPTGEPTILFERHLFERYTGGRFHGEMIHDSAISPSNSIISSAVPGGYGSPHVQHKKLQFAASLDRPAALKATSWGLFQILGVNHERAGFTLLQSFINAMYRSADDHLLAFVGFIRSDPRLWRALQTKDWLTAAQRYNGAKQKGYDIKVRNEYVRLSA
jgi:hypothetical protein